MISIIVFLVVFLIILFFLGQSVWVYLDGRERGDSYSVMWGLLALVCCPVGLIIYIIISREKNVLEKRYCKTCGHQINKEWNYCPGCSEKIDGGINDGSI